MKISLNWLKDYIDIPVSPEELSVILTDLGLEVEGMEEVESIKGGLEGVIVAEVVECIKHPNADKLSLTKVNTGAEDLLQVVCGAPNVAAGQKVLLAQIGTTLYTAEGEAWKIKKGKIRGEASEGMLCAEDELGLGASHEGIIVLPGEVQAGTLAKEYYNIENDIVYDIGLTPNRSDATSHIGVAQDLAAYFKVHHDIDAKINMADVSAVETKAKGKPIEVEIVDTVGCPRFSGLSISNVKVKESPDWLKNKLTSIGVRPISNIVDITNFVLHETGQPLHAYDQDKIDGGKIIVDSLPEGTAFMSLDDLERKLLAGDVMVCDSQRRPMCIGGVFGGKSSGVTDTTNTIFLEAAHFDAKRIRRTSTKHNLRTDAAMRFEKGSDPNGNLYALKRASLLIEELGEGNISSEIVDHYPNPIAPKVIHVRYQKINDLIGDDVEPSEAHKILEAQNMVLSNVSDLGFDVAVPTNKADVTRECDVIEEILRVYGFNQVNIDNVLRSTIIHNDDLDGYALSNRIADFLSPKGYNEMMNLSISQSVYYDALRPSISDRLIYINNTSNSHLNVMRGDMILPVLETLQYNQNRQQHQYKLYEVGRSYLRDEEKIKEQESIVIVCSGIDEQESWLASKGRTASYYAIKKVVRELLDKLNIQGYKEEELEDETYAYGLSMNRGPMRIGQYGCISKKLTDHFELREKVYFAELSLSVIKKLIGKSKLTVQEINKFPGTRRDLAMVVDNGVRFGQIEQLARKVDKKYIKQIVLFDVYTNDEQLGSGKKSYAVSFQLENVAKTMSDKEVDKIMNKLIQQYEKELGAVIRK